MQNSRTQQTRPVLATFPTYRADVVAVANEAIAAAGGYVDPGSTVCTRKSDKNGGEREEANGGDDRRKFKGRVTHAGTQHRRAVSL